jgi:hypothetical protein
MNAQPVPEELSGPCPLCGESVAVEFPRCGACGFDLAGVGGRPGPFTRTVFWLTAMGFLAVYLVTLAIVAFTR